MTGMFLSMGSQYIPSIAAEEEESEARLGALPLTGIAAFDMDVPAFVSAVEVLVPINELFQELIYKSKSKTDLVDGWSGKNGNIHGIM